MPVQKLFAVTAYAIWDIEHDGGDGFPAVRKIAGKGYPAIGETLNRRSHIGISNVVVTYDAGPSRERPCGDGRKNVGQERRTTSNIVGLFLKEDAARRCLSGSMSGRETDLWTQETIREIGDRDALIVFSNKRIGEIGIGVSTDELIRRRVAEDLAHV